MKINYVILFLLMICGSVFSQQITLRVPLNYSEEPRGMVVTDSVTWKLNRVVTLGDTTCDHNWIQSEKEFHNTGMGCLVNHNGFHCSYDDAFMSQICTKCGRHEEYREQWVQHRELPPKTKYELEVEKWKEKNK